MEDRPVEEVRPRELEERRARARRVCDVESEVGVEPVVVGVAGGGGRFTLAGGAKLKARKTIDAIATIAASTISTMLVSRRCRPRGREFDLG